MNNKTIAMIAAVVLLIGGFCMVQAQDQPNEEPKSDANAITVDEYRRAEQEIRKRVAEGKISGEAAEIRLVEMRRLISD